MKTDENEACEESMYDDRLIRMWTGREHLNEDRLITCLRRQAGKVHDKEKRLRQAGMEWIGRDQAIVRTG